MATQCKEKDYNSYTAHLIWMEIQIQIQIQCAGVQTQNNRNWVTLQIPTDCIMSTYKRNMVVHWVAVLPQSKKVLGLSPGLGFSVHDMCV